MKSAIRRGVDNKRVSLKPHSIKAEYSFGLLTACALARFGSRTVPSATPNEALGNSMSRSAYESHVTLPVANLDAIFVLMIRLSCETETANAAGAIFIKMRLTPRCASAFNGFIPILG